MLAEGILTYAEAAHELHRSRSTIEHLVSDGILPPVRVKGMRNKGIRKEDIERYKRGVVTRTSARQHAQTPDAMPRQPDQGGQGGAVQASTLTVDDKAILATMGDKFVALAAAIASALAPYLGNSYAAFFQYKTAEVQGGPLGEYMHQTKQTMLEAARQATQTGMTEQLIADTLEKVANSAAKATGPLTPDDLLFQKELQEMLVRHVQRSGALTTDAAPVAAVA